MTEPQGPGEQRYGAPQPPPPRPFYRRKGCCVSIVVAALLLIIVLVAAVAVLVAWNRGGKEHTVRFEVTGTSDSVSVNYGTAGSFSRVDAKPPWSQTRKVKGWNAATLTVTNRTNEGTLECKIHVDGDLKAVSTADGPYGTATCNAAID